MLNSISIFCGSSAGTNPIYQKAAQQVGHFFANHNIQLVYGAGNVGLMGVIADAVLEKGGYVIGVIPDFLKAKEVYHTEIQECHVTETMHERKKMMADLSEGVIAMPGGFGTLDELFDMLTLGQLQRHNYPIGILNVNGYYDHLLKQLKFMVAEGFVRQSNIDSLLVANNIETLITKMNAYAPDTNDKWI
ncbi:MAG: TIGR00730 family Rossman fold protein [Saprospiraceae bacterium]